MLDQYVDLLSACAQGGAQAAGDAILMLQVVLLAVVMVAAALVVAAMALLAAPYAARSEWAERQRLWERISAACEADVAGTRLVGRTLRWLSEPAGDRPSPAEREEQREERGASRDAAEQEEPEEQSA